MAQIPNPVLLKGPGTAAVPAPCVSQGSPGSRALCSASCLSPSPGEDPACCESHTPLARTSGTRKAPWQPLLAFQSLEAEGILLPQELGREFARAALGAAGPALPGPGDPCLHLSKTQSQGRC